MALAFNPNSQSNETIPELWGNAKPTCLEVYRKIDHTKDPNLIAAIEAMLANMDSRIDSNLDCSTLVVPIVGVLEDESGMIRERFDNRQQQLLAELLDKLKPLARIIAKSPSTEYTPPEPSELRPRIISEEPESVEKMYPEYYDRKFDTKKTVQA